MLRSPASQRAPSRRLVRAVLATILAGFVGMGSIGVSPVHAQSQAQAGPQAPRPQSVTVNGLQLEVAPAAAEGVWRITARPADGAPSVGGEHPQVDPNTGQITILAADGKALWRGQVKRLDTFGRAQVPGLEISWQASPEERLYGLGERFDSFDQAGKRVELWIEDAPGQGDDGSRTYYANPLVYSSAGYAFFADSNPEGQFDLNSSGDGVNRYRRAGQAVTFHIATGPTLADLIAQRTAIHGAPRNIPDWAWGPWISRNSFETQDEAEEAIEGHVKRGYPVAAIVQEAWKGPSETGDFNNFSKERWPRLEAFFELCRKHDIKNVLWQVPVIHPSSPFYKEGVEKGFFVKKPDGSVSHRLEWLAGFANIDFTNPDAVKWWKDMMRNEVRMGVAGYKADDGEDIKPDDAFHDGRRGWEMHNEYSTLYNKALIELLDEENANGLLWARSGSLGNEKYPALWAGDQMATWQQLRSLIPAGLSTSISGMPYWGHDIGGYVGQPSPELYIRWLQLGTFSPLMQYHGIQRREPWEFGQQADDAYGLLAHLRMNLKPALIALGEEAARTGLPIMRPMTLHYPNDPRFGGDDTQYLLGSNMLVAPVLEEGEAGRIVHFPQGTWHHALAPIAFTGPSSYEVPVGMVDAPLFVREGAAVPVQLTEGKNLGDWAADAPVREMTFTANRAVIRNLRAPLVGDPVSRETRLTFEVASGYTGPITAQWHWADAPQTIHDADVKITEQGGRRVASVDLTPAADVQVTGRRQVYVLREASPAQTDRPQLNFRGEIDWNSPLAIQVQSNGSRVADAAGGSRPIFTSLRNRSGRAVQVTVAAQPSEGARVSPESQTVSIPAHGQAQAEWTVTLPPGEGRIGDARVGFTASAAETQLAAGNSVFVYPGRWVVAGPFPAAKRMAHATRFAPEWEQSADVAFEAAGGQRVHWQQVPADHLAEHGSISFGDLFGRHEQAAAYAMTRLVSDREQPVELRFGSDDTLRVWLNGRLVHSVETYRAAEPDQEIVPVTLQKGVNTIVAKVGQDVAGWELIFRLTGPDGAPAQGVRDGFDAQAWQAYAADRPRSERIARQPEAFTWRVLGPIAQVPKAKSDWSVPADQQALSADAGSDWRPVPAAQAPANRIDLNDLLGPTGNAVAYVATEIEADAAQEVVLVGGSDDGLTVWLNGQLVHQAETPREFKPDSDRVPVTLRPGRNTLVARVSQGGGQWLVQIDLQDPSGRPLR